MRHYRSILLLTALLFLLLSPMMTGCSRVGDGHERRLLVIHAWGDQSGEYEKEVRQQYDKAAKANQADVHIRHVFLHRPVTARARATRILCDTLRALRSAGWKPDVIITHGDDALEFYLRCAVRQKGYTTTPCVYAGVICQDRMLSMAPYDAVPCTGFRDSLYIHECFDMMRDIWHDKGSCLVELDSTAVDVFVSQALHKALSDTTRYIDNWDLHIDKAASFRHFEDSTDQRALVHFLSVEYPGANSPRDTVLSASERERLGRSYIRDTYHNAKYLHQLQGNYGLYSNLVIDHSRMAQVSLTNAQFGQQHPCRILGGYFALLETQVGDALGYALRIMDGTPVRQLPRAIHHADYYLSWTALKMNGIQTGGLDARYHITGIPMSMRNRQAYDLMCIGAILLLAIVITAILFTVFWYLFHINKRREMQQLETIEWMLGGSRSGMWHYLMGEIYLSPNLKNILDTKRDVVTNREFLFMVHPDDREMMAKVLNFDDLQEGFHSHRYRMRLSDDPEYHWYRLSYAVGEMTVRRKAVDGLIRRIDLEVQEEQQLQETLQNAEETKLKEAFLANMTHDIRSPLSTIVSYANLLATDGMSLPAEERHVFVEQIEQSIHVMLTLLSDVVNVSRMQLGEYRYMLQPCSVAEFVAKTYRANNVQVPSHIEFILKKSEDAIIEVDADRLTQVLNNFISNAIKNTPSGSITLGWTVDEGMVDIYVEDTGIGISEENLETIFEKYTKFDGKSGAGLGLNICKTIVEKQNGCIRVSSKLGVGSRFSACFPIMDNALTGDNDAQS